MSRTETQNLRRRSVWRCWVTRDTLMVTFTQMPSFRSLRIVIVRAVALTIACMFALEFPLEGLVLKRVRSLVEEQLGQRLGVQVDIERISLWPGGVRISNLVLSGLQAPDNAGEPVALGAVKAGLSAHSVRVAFDWWKALTQRDLQIDGIELNEVNAYLPAVAGGGERAAEQLPQLMQDFLDTGVSWLSASDVTMSVVSTGRSDVRPLGVVDVWCRRRGTELELRLDVADLASVGHVFGPVEARANIEDSSMQLSGSLQLDPQRLTQTVEALSSALPDGTVVRANGATLDFSLSGPLQDAERWLGSVHVQLNEPVVTFRQLPALALQRLSLEGVQGVRGLQLTAVEAFADGMRLRSEVSAASRDEQLLTAQLEFDDLGKLNQLFPGVLKSESLRQTKPAPVGVVAEIQWDERAARARGTIVSENLAWRVPWGSHELVAQNAVTEFSYATDTEALELRGLTVTGPTGRLRGQVHLQGQSHHVQLSMQHVDARLLPGALLGSFERGHVDAELTADGSALQPLREMDARWKLEHALWTPEPSSAAKGAPVLSALVLDQAHGRVVTSQGGGRLSGVELQGAIRLRGEDKPLRAALGIDANWNERGYEAGVSLKELDAALLNAVANEHLPGRLEGALRGAVHLTGKRFESLVNGEGLQLDGRLQLDRGVWWPGPEYGSGVRVELKHAAVAASVQDGGWRLTDIDLNARSGPSQYGQLEHGTLRGSLATTDDGSGAGLDADLVLSDWLWSPPAQLQEIGPVNLSRASARLRRRQDRWSASQLQLKIDADEFGGEVRGSAHWSPVEHDVQFEAKVDKNQWLRDFAPGDLQVGALSVSGELRGSSQHPVRSIAGQVSTRDARWDAPPALALCSSHFAIKQLRADYSWQSDRLELSRMLVDTPLLKAQGELLRQSGKTQLETRLSSARVDELLNLVPELAGLLRRGRSQALLSLTEDEEGFSGVLRGEVNNTEVRLSAANAAQVVTYPVDRATFGYEFRPRWQGIRGLRIRGPELNADLDASWFEDGTVLGDGQLWFTRDYSRRMAGGAQWMLDLLGYSKIDSRFVLSGTLDDVRMDTAIAHGARWRLLRVALSERLQRVLRGEVPLLRLDKARQSCPRE